MGSVLKGKKVIGSLNHGQPKMVDIPHHYHSLQQVKQAVLYQDGNQDQAPQPPLELLKHGH